MKTEKLKLNLDIVLPKSPDEHDACIDRLISTLSYKAGVEKAHIEQQEQKMKLCIHFDPDLISLSRLEQIVNAEGAKLTERFGHSVFDINPPRHARHVDSIKQQLQAVRGVLSSRVAGTGKVILEFDRKMVSDAQLKMEIGRLVDFISEPSFSDDHEHEDGHCNHKNHNHDEGSHNHFSFGLGERAEIIFSITSALTLGIGFGIEKLAGAQPWVPTAFYIAAYFFGGFFTVIEAIENLKRKKFEIDTLMLVAAIGAAILGEWAEGALLLVLFSLGHALEHYAMGRAKKAIEALANLAPKSARVFRGSEIVEIDVSQIKIGDRIAVRPNERLPVDGYVAKGTSSINQAPVTGESIPVDKFPVKDFSFAEKNPNKISAESRVFTGTINGSGALEVVATKISSESTLARIVKLVSEAQAEASPTEQFTKKIERYFVPAILVLAVLLPFAFLVIDETFSASFYRAMAVLVAASPCALAISTPSAVLSGIARAGRSGVLIKSGAALENLGNLTAIAFDKTGTLTEGKPVVTDVITLNNTSESDLLKFAAAVERSSDHPLAKAILTYAESRLQAPAPEAIDVQSLTGKGIQARVAGIDILVAKPSIFMDKFGSTLSAPVKKLQQEGRTLIVVATNDQVLGLFGVMDKPRETSKAALLSLTDSGIKKSIMLSGDHQTVAWSIAKQIGLTDAFGDLMPDDKVTAIKRLREEYGMVAMVGDGVNDAPAMASATVGIAMGAAGSDVALETADIALMTDDLNQLAFSVRMSRQASRIIKQNLWVSLGVVAFLLPATIFGLGIGAAVAFHEGSTLIVVFNALRLLLYKDKLAQLEIRAANQ